MKPSASYSATYRRTSSTRFSVSSTGDGSGSIDLRELQAAVRPPASSANTSAQPSPSPARPPLRLQQNDAAGRNNSAFGTRVLEGVVMSEGGTEDEDAVVDTLRAALVLHRVRVIDMFKKWDTDQSGKISLMEFRGGLAVIGLVAPLTAMTNLFNTFDADGSGAVEYEEMARALKPRRMDHGDDAAAAAPVVSRFALRKGGLAKRGSFLCSALASAGQDAAQMTPQERLRKALADNVARVIDLFREWDVNGDGVVSKGEFSRALHSLGLTQERTLARAVFDTFDIDGSGEISIGEMDVALKPRPAPPDPYIPNPRQKLLVPPIPMAGHPALGTPSPSPTAQSHSARNHHAAIPPIEANVATLKPTSARISAQEFGSVPPLGLSAPGSRPLPRMYSPRQFISPRNSPRRVQDDKWFEMLAQKNKLPPPSRCAPLGDPVAAECWPQQPRPPSTLPQSTRGPRPTPRGDSCVLLGESPSPPHTRAPALVKVLPRKRTATRHRPNTATKSRHELDAFEERVGAMVEERRRRAAVPVSVARSVGAGEGDSLLRLCCAPRE